MVRRFGRGDTGIPTVLLPHLLHIHDNNTSTPDPQDMSISLATKDSSHFTIHSAVLPCRVRRRREEERDDDEKYMQEASI
jgi:hypothetical protein